MYRQPTTLKLLALKTLRSLFGRVSHSSPRLDRIRRRIELGYLFRTDLVQYRVERAREMGAKVGKGCRFFSLQIFSEPTLVEIGENTIMSGDVTLLTHDGAIHSAAYNEIPDINGHYGRVVIGKNCFIGYGSIIMPNVRIGDGSIVCAGSVVLESVPENSVVMGNPAKVVFPRSMWVKMKQHSPFTIIDPEYRFPLELPEHVLMERVAHLPMREPRRQLVEQGSR